MNSSEFIEICDTKICDINSFNELVDLTYNVIRDFYCDSTIKEKIGDNLPRFLKATIENDAKVKSILEDKVDSRI